MDSSPQASQSPLDRDASLYAVACPVGLQLPKLFPGPMAVVMVVALLTILPFFVWGNPSGHDFEFHMNSWMEVVGQWKQGILYPHWAALAHWGYGEARFLFYPPASWHLGALLALFMPWAAVPGAYIWIALSTAGCSMYLLARRWLPRTDAVFAAALYTANPYHLVVIYWRSALAELLASCLLPLLLLGVLSLAEGRRRSIVPLSLVVAAAWLTNGPSAVMVNYSVVLLAVVVAVLHRQPRVLCWAAASVLLGGLLASFYLLPAAYEQSWVSLSQVFAPGVRPQDNFLFTILNDPDHNRFNWIVSTIAAAEMVVATGALALTSRSRRSQPLLWWALAAWAVAPALLMLPFTGFLWEHLPKLRFVQLPWRWLLCLNVTFALALTTAFRRWWQRIALYGTMLLVLGFLWHRVQPPWWDTAADIAEMHDAIVDGSGYEGTDEYVPAGVDPYDVNKDAPQVLLEDGGSGARAEVRRWGAQSKEFTIVANQPLHARLRLFNYPAWSVSVDGSPVVSETAETTGEMTIPLKAGTHRVVVTFARTWDRITGALLSLLSAFLALGLMWTKRIRTSVTNANETSMRKSMKRVLIATSNAGKLRDFGGAAAEHGVETVAIPNFASLPTPVEDGKTFEENAIKKANEYSLAVPGEIVIADDSGLEIDALKGAPGVHSARYAADKPHQAEANTDDALNNARVSRELEGLPPELRTARFVCVLAAACNGKTLATFRGVAEGQILAQPRGHGGFGYDPLFYFPSIGRTFAELSPEEKSRYSHRGAAFRKFLAWYEDAGRRALA